MGRRHSILRAPLAKHIFGGFSTSFTLHSSLFSDFTLFSFPIQCFSKFFIDIKLLFPSPYLQPFSSSNVGLNISLSEGRCAIGKIVCGLVILSFRFPILLCWPLGTGTPTGLVTVDPTCLHATCVHLSVNVQCFALVVSLPFST